MGHGFGDGSCIDWHQRHVVCACSALCRLLSSPRGVRSYGGRHGLGSLLGLLGLFVFSILLLDFD